MTDQTPDPKTSIPELTGVTPGGTTMRVEAPSASSPTPPASSKSVPKAHLPPTSKPTGPAPTKKSTKEPTPLSSHPASHPAIVLRSPLKYNPVLASSKDFVSPPLPWLERTWTVTHSTLPMWRKAKNVRITYRIIPAAKEGGVVCLDDTVESEPTARTWLPQPKAIKGVDTPVFFPGAVPATASVSSSVSAAARAKHHRATDKGWNWRGKGLLKIASSHWEVLGWGELGDEKWVVTWFAPSLFTPAGLDVYSDKKGGISEGLYGDIEKALWGLEAAEMGELCKKDMKKVVIDDA